MFSVFFAKALWVPVLQSEVCCACLYPIGQASGGCRCPRIAHV